jgi:phage tail-like protein
MAIQRDKPYSQFNFIVTLGDDGGKDSPDGGFQEISGLGMEINIAEYRAGNAKINHAQKVPGLAKVEDITLKRGLFGSVALTSWISAVRDGTAAQERPVTIELLSEDRTTVMTWVLSGALPKKLTGPAFNGKGTDVAIEELVIVAETIKYE